ncbi:MAG: Ribosomal large subunit pseudouridine synthase B [Chlamydiia bacterium]|nr:Ribosomal large subunit pseudouridine synthase B [Chlamydiia bacterium]MCH9616197.1 Ribosomal large subunit pseudouridine synthase B [Chlamydiia bacterium]MCH9629817.1 Ribosomal large subunit pseudouridine synthase B [Chlamydiia bacterium]
MIEERLSKVIARAGVTSRRKAEELIFAGKVKVNGKKILVPQTKVALPRDRIEVDGYTLAKEESKVYYVLNKPKGFICSHEGRKRVYDLLPDTERIFSIGRLDRDTKGLLLFTNDGHFAQEVIHPSANISKEYLVKVNSEVMDEHLKAVSKGTLIEGKWIRPVRVSKVRKGTLKVVVKEGKKREVRLLVENAGLTIYELSRIRIGGLALPKLKEGTFRPMTEKEKRAIFS